MCGGVDVWGVGGGWVSRWVGQLNTDVVRLSYTFIHVWRINSHGQLFSPHSTAMMP